MGVTRLVKVSMLLSALGDHVQQVLPFRAQSPDGPRREEGTCSETRERLTLEADVTHMFNWGRVRGLGVCIDRKSSELQGDGDGTLFGTPQIWVLLLSGSCLAGGSWGCLLVVYFLQGSCLLTGIWQ